jgi:hypothetical protein
VVVAAALVVEQEDARAEVAEELVLGCVGVEEKPMLGAWSGAPRHANHAGGGGRPWRCAQACSSSGSELDFCNPWPDVQERSSGSTPCPSPALYLLSSPSECEQVGRAVMNAPAHALNATGRS